MTLSNFHLRSPLEIHRDFLQCPERRTSELLLQNYWANVHPIARVLHRPSFTVLWMTFWESHGLGSKIDKSSLALVIATLLAASVSMPDDVVQRELKREKSDLVQQMRVAADNALARSNWIHSTQIETLQAIVIYLVSVQVFCRASFKSLLLWVFFFSILIATSSCSLSHVHVPDFN